MTPENHAQYEYQKMQLVGSLNQIANGMRECAVFADQFAHILSTIPYNGNPAPFPPLANGQYPIPGMPSAPMNQDELGKKRKSRMDDSEVKRRAKKPKDPNAPKRPASSYLLFQNDIRNELKAKNPGMRNNELLSNISKLWADMPQAQKDAYEARNKVLKDEWIAQKAIYESAGAGTSAVTAAIASPVVVAKPIPVTSPVAEESTSSDESTKGEEDDSESSPSSDEEAAAAPPPKKSKKDGVAAAPVKEDVVHSKKEKKHKKSKA